MDGIQFYVYCTATLDVDPTETVFLDIRRAVHQNTIVQLVKNNQAQVKLGLPFPNPLVRIDLLLPCFLAPGVGH